MRILHITDSHATVKNPEGRRDVYYISFLKKLYEIGYVCKQLEVNMVIHTGDLFHSAKVSNKFAGQVAELIKAMKVPFYVVPGNHDIEGYSTDTIDQTTLGLLNKTGVVKILDRDTPFVVSKKDTNGNELFTVGISGQEYYADIDNGNADDFSMQQPLQDINILCYHGYIADTPQHPSIRCTMVQDVNSDADIILTGHYHRSFMYENEDLSIYNPGSMMRVEQTEYNKTFYPQYGILDITLDGNNDVMYWYNLFAFKVAQPSSVVFDYDTKYKQKVASITLEGFQNSILNVMTQTNPSINIRTIIDEICIKQNVSKEIHDETINAYDNAVQSNPETFAAPQGYIEDQNKKTISCIDINNFQSHAKTHIDFCDGLNIIIGESNHGKTAIMRAIMWVIDNYPQGNSFITAGEPNCSVRITYSDGTYIERGRTQTDAGYYNIRYKDDTGAFKDVNYKGFANNIPVEIANVHQMPKASITKDIETHLNVLSQLDSPFLLTESPQTKASAIGRITGTHLIDSAIKEMAKTIRANKAVIKDAEKDRKDVQGQISQLPNIKLMKEVYDGYKAIIKYVESSKAGELAACLKKLDEQNMLYNKTQNTLNKYKQILAIKDVCVTAEKIYVFCKNTSVAVQECQDIFKRIKETECILQSAKKKLALKPIVQYATSQTILITELQTDMLQHQWHKEQIDKKSKDISLKKQIVDSFVCLELYINLCMSPVKGITKLLGQRNKISDDIQKAKMTLGSKNKYKQTLVNQVNNISKQVIQYIMERGNCPCCGMAFKSESIAERINKFLEEHHHV